MSTMDQQVGAPPRARDQTDATAGITLSVNGEVVAVRATTLDALVAELGYGVARVATALNGEFVPARLRASCVVRAGDRIEIVAPRQGG